MSDVGETVWPPEDAAAMQAFIREQLPERCFKNGDKTQELCPALEAMLKMKTYAYDSIHDAVVRRNVATMIKLTFFDIDLSCPLGVMCVDSLEGERLICRLGNMGLSAPDTVQVQVVKNMTTVDPGQSTEQQLG